LVDAILPADATLHRLNGDGRSTSPAYVQDSKDRSVLLLGSGRVSRSVVDYLGRSKHRSIVVASNNKDEAKEVASLSQRGRHAHIDLANDLPRLQKLVEESDAVISLLPAPMHPKIAELCIKAKTDLVTASYESKEMRQLGDSARVAGVKILNEVGLDPGLDHMSAMKMIDEIKDRGGRVTSFSSVCGGLPAPEAANNPLQYKFSWSPRGVISASQNDAQYLWDGQVLQVAGSELLANASPFLEAWPNEFQLEVLPNRDSLHYQKTYGLDDISTLFRGTLRYRGFSSLMYVFQNMGLFSTTPIDNVKSWRDVVGMLDQSRGGFASIEDFLLACADDDYDEALRAKECLEWLGMLSDEKVQFSPDDRTIVDIFCRRLEERLKFLADERDMVLMNHTIGAEFDDGTIEEHYSSLKVFGTEATMTAMCKTVGVPAAISVDLILGGHLDGKYGLLLPTSKDIYKPTLSVCEKEGISFEEHVKVVQHGRHTGTI
jgi:alpha-aminoadipic semialdehyde synthase